MNQDVKGRIDFLRDLARPPASHTRGDTPLPTRDRAAGSFLDNGSLISVVGGVSAPGHLQLRPPQLPQQAADLAERRQRLRGRLRRLGLPAQRPHRPAPSRRPPDRLDFDMCKDLGW